MCLLCGGEKPSRKAAAESRIPGKRLRRGIAVMPEQKRCRRGGTLRRDAARTDGTGKDLRGRGGKERERIVRSALGKQRTDGGRRRTADSRRITDRRVVRVSDTGDGDGYESSG